MTRIYASLFLLLPAFVSGGNKVTMESVLATGQWYKIAVQNTGVHVVTFSDLEGMGADPSSFAPGDIRVYGNGGGMLPEANSMPRTDDLTENSILVVDGGDGSFDQGDYFLFWGESPDVWLFDESTHQFTHRKNLYSDYSYYYITADLGPGKRVQPVASLDTTPDMTSIQFTDHAFHELDERNLIRSGKMWVGEEFNTATPYREFTFSFPNAITTMSVRLNTYVVGKSPDISTMYIYNDGMPVDQFTIDYTDPQSSSTYARFKQRTTNTTIESDNLTIGLEYDLPTQDSRAWLYYIEAIVQRFLKWEGPQMQFRNPATIGAGKNTLFRISDTPGNIVVWDVTDRGAIGSIQGIRDNLTGMYEFIVPTPVLKEFVAFDGSVLYPVIPAGHVDNQNLHGLDPASLIIVTHPMFMEQAERLAGFHRNETGLSVIVAETDQIYAEFASGKPDLTAIRDFIRMMYLRATDGNTPRYILLFGDGSFDFKDRILNNTNFVPCYQSAESLKYISSFVTDDYFGIMGESWGENSAGPLDLGMGRFPVSTIEQAKAIVDKIIHYASVNDTVQSSWRNVITFIADDEDTNLHLHQAEELCDIVASRYPVFNVNKIYSDAFQLVETPSGPRYPEVNKAIKRAFEDGSLIINYTGHGGEDAWSAEKIITIPDIENLDNPDKLPVLVTATCEFSRFDNPERFSGGEMIIVKPEAGVIAIYTTTRLALATSNFRLDTSFFLNLMKRDDDGLYMKMGDLLRISKNNNNNNANIRNFVLLGDPAQQIAFPGYRVVTTAINGDPVTSDPDTLLGLSVVSVSGEVQDQNGNKVTQFDGTVEASVFDKPVTYRTMANQPRSYKEYFQIQNALLSRGYALVENGEFSFSFVVPMDISPYFGFGKISYYSNSATADGNGYDDHVVIGGKDPSVNPGGEGPEIDLFFDSRDFVSGGQVSRDPMLIADLYDKDGINHVGLGLGHEMLASIDNDWSHAVVLNPFYIPGMGDYQRGTAFYPYSDLAIGRHELTVRAWDMFNNSSEQTITFFVFDHPAVHVTEVYTFPNPMTDGTTFTFRPDSGSGTLDVAIEISTITGQPVHMISETVTTNTGQPLQIYWDGTGRNEMKLPSGLYPYTVRLTGSNGGSTLTSGKIIILR